MAKYVTRSIKYQKAIAITFDFNTMEVKEHEVIVENPVDDINAFIGQVGEVLGLPVQAFKLKSKEAVKKEYRRMTTEDWLKYSEVFEPVKKDE